MRIEIFDFDTNKKIIFLPNSLRFFITTISTVEIVKKILNNVSKVDILREFPDVSSELYDNLYNIIFFAPKAAEKYSRSSYLGRLVINISNDCNMHCVYCYANKGKYHSSQGLISTGDLWRTLNVFYSLFSRIDVIQLFGGEPTLNINAIRYVCEYVSRHNYKTQVGFVTNGTIINTELIEIINKYHINVTVSVDIEKLHNELRPTNSGCLSYNQIEKNIMLLKRYTSQPSQFEVTYTNYHVKNNISILNIINEISSKYGDIPIHITPVSSKDLRYRLSSYQPFIDSVRDIFKYNQERGNINYSLLSSLELGLKYHINRQYLCGAGTTTLSVSTDGKIYPCFYFTDNPQFYMASIYENKEIIWNKIQKIKNYYLAHPKTANAKCKECFANSLCHGCMGSNYDETGDPFNCDEAWCNMIRNMVKQTIVEVAKICYQKGRTKYGHSTI